MSDSFICLFCAIPAGIGFLLIFTPIISIWNDAYKWNLKVDWNLAAPVLHVTGLVVFLGSSSMILLHLYSASTAVIVAGLIIVAYGMLWSLFSYSAFTAIYRERSVQNFLFGLNEIISKYIYWLALLIILFGVVLKF